VKRLDSSYIKKLQKENKTAILAALDLLKNDHRLWLSTIFTTSALKNRKFVYAFIDRNEKRDANLFNYFKIADISQPQLILFDFEQRYHHVHENNNIDELIQRYDNGILDWSTGNWFEDILLKFGIQLSHNFIIYFLIIAFVLLIGLLITLVFCCGDSITDEEKESNEQDIKTKKEQ
jgi:hypothetical protein